MITTNHQYLDKYPIPKHTRYLIIGTIHPHRVKNFNIDYFYGNKGSLWSIFSNAFPQHNFESAEAIDQTLKNYDTAISDMIVRCDRKNEFITQDKDLKNLVINKNALLYALTNFEIREIFFTSRFGVNNAARLFIDHFKINFKQSWNKNDHTFTIPKEVFGREIIAHTLYSPSGQANIGIAQSKSYKKVIHFYNHFETPIKKYRIDYYRNKFAYFLFYIVLLISDFLPCSNCLF